MNTYLILFVIGVFFVPSSFAGECCESYYGTLLDYHDAQWCDTYCCGDETSSKGLYCCSNIFDRADSFYIDGICGLWWSHHVWAPILIVIGNLLILASCIFCCYKCCCARNRTVVVQQQMAYPGQFATTVQTTSSSGQSVGYGYDQQQQFPKY